MEATAIAVRPRLQIARWAPPLVAVSILGLAVAFLPGPSRPLYNPVLGLQFVASALRGEGPRADFASDYVGARALLRREDPYPASKPAFRSIGLNWNAKGRSTHPPTAYLFAIPLTWLPWRQAEAVWTALMLLALIGSFAALGLTTSRAIVAGLIALLWAPAAWSVEQQLTPLWLLAIACAYRWRNRPSRAGLMIGIAALTKLTPAILIVPFLLQRRWKALWAMLAALVAALATTLLLEPSAFHAYLSEGRKESILQVHRPDNAALVAAAYHGLGLAGLVGVLACLLTAVVVGVFWRDRSESWWIWPWLSVAILPIAWVYSLLPLLLGLLMAVRARYPIALVAACLAITVPIVLVPFGNAPGAYGFALSTLFAGLAAIALTAYTAGAPRIVSSSARRAGRAQRGFRPAR